MAVRWTTGEEEEEEGDGATDPVGLGVDQMVPRLDDPTTMEEEDDRFLLAAIREARKRTVTSAAHADVDNAPAPRRPRPASVRSDGGGAPAMGLDYEPSNNHPAGADPTSAIAMAAVVPAPAPVSVAASTPNMRLLAFCLERLAMIPAVAHTPHGFYRSAAECAAFLREHAHSLAAGYEAFVAELSNVDNLMPLLPSPKVSVGGGDAMVLARLCRGQCRARTGHHHLAGCGSFLPWLRAVFVEAFLSDRTGAEGALGSLSHGREALDQVITVHNTLATRINAALRALFTRDWTPRPRTGTSLIPRLVVDPGAVSHLRREIDPRVRLADRMLWNRDAGCPVLLYDAGGTAPAREVPVIFTPCFGDSEDYRRAKVVAVRDAHRWALAARLREAVQGRAPFWMAVQIGVHGVSAADQRVWTDGDMVNGLLSWHGRYTAALDHYAGQVNAINQMGANGLAPHIIARHDAMAWDQLCQVSFSTGCVRLSLAP